MTTAPDRRVLANDTVLLRPLVPADAAALFAALDDPLVWSAGYRGVVPARPSSPADLRAGIAATTAAEPTRVTYAVVLATAVGDLPAGTLVGTSSLMDVDLPNESLHLGSTAYAPAVWSGAVNPATKLALLKHAFEDCGFGRVRLQTDVLNTRSQAAIARLGAVREGVLRRHVRRADGTWRDTVVFSVLAEEWPAVRAGLLARLGVPVHPAQWAGAEGTPEV